MTLPTDRFLHAEQMADSLVEALKQLRDEAVSYKTSAEQLSEVRSKLGVFIEKTERISQDTHDLIGVMREIGGPEILRAIASVSEESNKAAASNARQQRQIKVLLVLILVSGVLALSGIIWLLLK